MTCSADLNHVSGAAIKAHPIFKDSLSPFTSIHPNVPRLLSIQTLLLSTRTDLLGEQPLVVTIVPLGNILRRRHLSLREECIFPSIAQQHVEGLLRALPGADEDVGEFGRVYELAGPHEHLAALLHLLDAVGCERDVGFAGVSSVDGPFGLASSWALAFPRQRVSERDVYRDGR